MLRLRLLVLSLLLGTFLIVPPATSASGCGPADGAFPVAGSLYLSNGEVWRETNQLPGLQKTARGCTDGTTVPPDTFVAEAPDVPPIPWCIGNICII